MSFVILLILYSLLPMLPGVILGGVALTMKRASSPHAKFVAKAALFTFVPGLLLTLNAWFGWVRLPWL